MRRISRFDAFKCIMHTRKFNDFSENDCQFIDGGWQFSHTILLSRMKLIIKFTFIFKSSICNRFCIRSLSHSLVRLCFQYVLILMCTQQQIVICVKLNRMSTLSVEIVYKTINLNILQIKKMICYMFVYVLFVRMISMQPHSSSIENTRA